MLAVVNLLFVTFVLAPLVGADLPLPYGRLVGDRVAQPNDDGSNFPLLLNPPMNFFNGNVDQVYQNTNGLISFGSPFERPSIDSTLPSPWYPALIASYWCDIDVTVEGKMYARVVSQTTDLDAANNIVALAAGNNNFVGTSAFVVTWVNVPPFGGGAGQNTFQTIMVYDGDETWVIFAYDKLEFFGVINSLVGFNAGDGIEGGTLAIVDSDQDMETLLTKTNCNTPGVYAYRVDNAFSHAPTGSPAPSVSSAPTQSPPKLPLPYGLDAGDVLTPANDNGSSDVIPLFQPMRFYNTEFNQAYQNTNGHISFDFPYSEYYPWDGFPSSSYPALVASYWDDLDTTNGGEMYARAVTAESDLALANNIVAGATGNNEFNGTAAFVATWIEVKVPVWAEGPSIGGDDRINTFQTTLVYNTNETWVIYAYDQLEFFFNYPVVVGWNAGVDYAGELFAEFFSDEDMLQLLTGTNCDISGVYAYQIETNPPPVCTSIYAFLANGRCINPCLKGKAVRLLLALGFQEGNCP